jgi:hypothetical protein
LLQRSHSSLGVGWNSSLRFSAKMYGRLKVSHCGADLSAFAGCELRKLTGSHRHDIVASLRRIARRERGTSRKTPFWPIEPTLIFRNGATSGILRQRNIGASIEASECRRTGA